MWFLDAKNHFQPQSYKPGNHDPYISSLLTAFDSDTTNHFLTSFIRRYMRIQVVSMLKKKIGKKAHLWE